MMRHIFDTFFVPMNSLSQAPSFLKYRVSQVVHWTSPSVSSHSVQWAGHAVNRKHVCCHILMMLLQWQKLGKICTVPRYKLLLSFTIISYVSRSFIPNETTLTTCCLAQWISKLPMSFEIHWLRQYLVNFTDLAGMINATVYKTKPIFIGLGHCKLF